MDNTSIANLIFALFLVSVTMLGLNFLFYEVYKDKLKMVMWGVFSAITCFIFMKMDVELYEMDKIVYTMIRLVIYLPIPVYSLAKYVREYEENSKPSRKNDKFLKDYFPMLASDNLLVVILGGFLYFLIFIYFLQFNILVFLFGIKKLATIFTIGYFSRVRKKIKRNLTLYPEIVILVVSSILFIFI